MSCIITFIVTSTDVIPITQPLGIPYTIFNEYRNDDLIHYELVVELETPEMVFMYWPFARDVKLATTEVAKKIETKKIPTGKEKTIVRFRFNLPSNQSVDITPYPKLVNWCVSGGIGYRVWFVCVDSFDQLIELYPNAWGVEVVAEGLVCV